MSHQDRANYMDQEKQLDSIKIQITVWDIKKKKIYPNDRHINLGGQCSPKSLILEIYIAPKINMENSNPWTKRHYQYQSINKKKKRRGKERITSTTTINFNMNLHSNELGSWSPPIECTLCCIWKTFNEFIYTNQGALAWFEQQSQSSPSQQESVMEWHQ